MDRYWAWTMLIDWCQRRNRSAEHTCLCGWRSAKSKVNRNMMNQNQVSCALDPYLIKSFNVQLKFWVMFCLYDFVANGHWAGHFGQICTMVLRQRVRQNNPDRIVDQPAGTLRTQPIVVAPYEARAKETGCIQHWWSTHNTKKAMH